MPMNRLTFHASRLRQRLGDGGPATVVPGRSAAGSHTSAATRAGSAQAASDASHEPSASSSGAASAAPSVSDIEYAPVSIPVSAGWRSRMNTGSTACAIATASPASAQPANSGAHPPAPRIPAATAVSSAQPTSTRSIETRRVSRGASGAKPPNASTGSVVSSPAAKPERPRSARTWVSRGGRLATSVRRFSASSTIAVITPAADPRRAPADATPMSASDGEEDGLIGTLEAHVETVSAPLARGDEGRPGRRVERGEQRIGGVGLLLVGEVDPGHHAVQQPAGEHGDGDVRRLAAGRARLHRADRPRAGPVGRAAPEAAEARRLIAPAGVGLPRLDQRVGDRLALAVEDRAAQPDRAVGPLGDDIWAVGPRQPDREERADGLRGGDAHSKGVTSHPRRTMSKR